MATAIFIDSQDIMTYTVLSGNVDIDKLQPVILEAQQQTIEEMLGSELYDKIYADFVAKTLTGLYLELFNDYIVYVLRSQSTANYILISPYSVGNGGFFKRTYNGVETVDVKEVERVSQIYSSKAQMHINRFNKWIGLNPLPEYKTNQDEVNAKKTINLTSTWYL
tara:strand:- start:195 stop:689 length:495 start_codon:yes stop_codon:yes gene_type:complete